MASAFSNFVKVWVNLEVKVKRVLVSNTRIKEIWVIQAVLVIIRFE